mmetsp:Transcript_99729/g.237742  ORF Transcript_99729/g.237742 Transcript_99729/m.237742 type:complete len:461 (+) Transcript_99729:674-2056(+)
MAGGEGRAPGTAFIKTSRAASASRPAPGGSTPRDESSCEPRPSKADEISSGSNRSAPFAVANTFCQRSESSPQRPRKTAPSHRRAGVCTSGLPGSAAVSFRSGKSGKEGSSSMSATASAPASLPSAGRTTAPRTLYSSAMIRRPVPLESAQAWATKPSGHWPPLYARQAAMWRAPKSSAPSLRRRRSSLESLDSHRDFLQLRLISAAGKRSEARRKAPRPRRRTSQGRRKSPVEVCTHETSESCSRMPSLETLQKGSATGSPSSVNARREISGEAWQALAKAWGRASRTTWFGREPRCKSLRFATKSKQSQWRANPNPTIRMGKEQNRGSHRLHVSASSSTGNASTSSAFMLCKDPDATGARWRYTRYLCSWCSCAGSCCSMTTEQDLTSIGSGVISLADRSPLRRSLGVEAAWPRSSMHRSRRRKSSEARPCDASSSISWLMADASPALRRGRNSTVFP